MIGAIIKRRADDLNNYYVLGVFISWSPVVNIIGYLVIIFVEHAKWIKKKADDGFLRQQKIRLAICVSVILLLQCQLLKKEDGKTLMITFMAFYSLAKIIIAEFKRSLRAVVIASALLHFFIAFLQLAV